MGNRRGESVFEEARKRAILIGISPFRTGGLIKTMSYILKKNLSLIFIVIPHQLKSEMSLQSAAWEKLCPFLHRLSVIFKNVDT